MVYKFIYFSFYLLNNSSSSNCAAKVFFSIFNLFINFNSSLKDTNCCLRLSNSSLKIALCSLIFNIIFFSFCWYEYFAAKLHKYLLYAIRSWVVLSFFKLVANKFGSLPFLSNVMFELSSTKYKRLVITIKNVYFYSIYIVHTSKSQITI